jgi:hypothetical protein
MCEETVSRVDRFFCMKDLPFSQRLRQFRSGGENLKKVHFARKKYKKKEAREAIRLIFLLLSIQFNTKVFILKIDTRLIRYDVMYSSRAQQTK